MGYSSLQARNGKKTLDMFKADDANRVQIGFDAVGELLQAAHCSEGVFIDDEESSKDSMNFLCQDFSIKDKKTGELTTKAGKKGIVGSFIGKGAFWRPTMTHRIIKVDHKLLTPMGFMGTSTPLAKPPSSVRSALRTVFDTDHEGSKLACIYNVHLTPFNEEVTLMELKGLAMWHQETADQDRCQAALVAGDWNNDVTVIQKLLEGVPNWPFELLSGGDPTGFNQPETIDVFWATKQFREEYRILNPVDKDDPTKFKTMFKRPESDHMPAYLDFDHIDEDKHIFGSKH